MNYLDTTLVNLYGEAARPKLLGALARRKATCAVAAALQLPHEQCTGAQGEPWLLRERDRALLRLPGR